jgi:His-Xaa-Ser system radical SAM maturase HxsC
MKSFEGTPLREQAVIGILTNSEEVSPRGNYVLVKDYLKFFDLGYAGYICSSEKLPLFSKAGLVVPSLQPFKDASGDIALIMPDGVVSLVWEKNSSSNALFLTEACNANCNMCPQPPKPHDPIHSINAHRVLDLLKTENVPQICLTGGEPTLLGKEFISLLDRCVIEHPESQIEVLTNGQTLANFEVAKSIASVCTPKVRFCVSLHADTEDIHDSIVQTKGAYWRTHKGIFNLARFRISTEIRFVICKSNFERLPTLPDFIFRNYPFINHLAIMGLEMTGYALKNENEVWVDPLDYSQELARFAQEARRRNLPVSIYNHQLCVIPPETRYLARQAISDWKQEYISSCELCMLKKECGGVFTTSGKILSRGINPIIAN